VPAAKFEVGPVTLLVRVMETGRGVFVRVGVKVGVPPPPPQTKLSAGLEMRL
jgi:hypothetical protein